MRRKSRIRLTKFHDQFCRLKVCRLVFPLQHQLRADTVCVHFVFGNIVARQMHVTSMNCANGCLCAVSAVLIATKLSNVSLQIEMQTLERNKNRNKTKQKLERASLKSLPIYFCLNIYCMLKCFIFSHFILCLNIARTDHFDLQNRHLNFEFRTQKSDWRTRCVCLQSEFGIRHSASTM